MTLTHRDIDRLQSVGARIDDPHILSKIATATTHEELDGIRMGFQYQGREPDADVVQAIARRRAELGVRG